MLERQMRFLKDALAANAMRTVTEIRVSEEVKNRLKELLVNGDIPVVYGNHQGHADGIPLSVLSGFLKKLAAPAPRDLRLRGLAILLATTMGSGEQGEELKLTYDVLVGGAERMGVTPVLYTREVDVVRYGRSRGDMFRESLSLARALKGHYGIGVLPEGTVQGGRHPEGADIEDIYGMQELRSDILINFFSLAKGKKKLHPRRAFFLPVGLHGSFRVMQSPEGGKPYLTPEGKRALRLGAFGLSTDLKVQATLLMPFTEEEIIADLGDDWRNYILRFNRYAMEKIVPGIPPIAAGVYGITNGEAIELSLTP